MLFSLDFLTFAFSFPESFLFLEKNNLMVERIKNEPKNLGGADTLIPYYKLLNFKKIHLHCSILLQNCSKS